MATTTIRVRAKTHKMLKSLANSSGVSMQDVLDRAVEDFQRRAYLEGLKADYAALRADPKAARDFDKEVALWDRTNADGLEDL